ncbi:inositol 2-dehydrogenase [Pseudarthrobacter sp. N5]|uniref:inositol 2-dehydrogenase n=1 Tax=Pseudarthrobacter sp. N5 TaxID=3418416 RepID=UPI003CF0E624
MVATEKLRVALFGSGRIGRVHAANLGQHPGVDLVWIADPFIAGAQELAALYGARATASGAEVFADGSLDAVVVCSPTDTHVELIRSAAEHRLAVLCEKPVDLDLERARQCRNSLKDQASDGGPTVMLGFNRRFDPAFASVRERVEAGEIGTLEQLTIISRDPAPAPEAYIRSSGGIFRDMSIHDLDMARFFVPDIVEVTAHGSTVFCDYIRDAGDYDSAVVTLRGRGGELVTITNSRHSAYGYDQRLEAFGSAGMLQAGNISPNTVRKYAADAVEQGVPYEPFFLERYSAAYRLELDHFVSAVRSGGSCRPGIDDGVAALVLAEAAGESAATGRTVPVDLDANTFGKNTKSTIEGAI